MIHAKVSSPSYATLRKKRRTSSGKTLVSSGKSSRLCDKSTLIESEDPAPVKYADLYRREKFQMSSLLKKKKENLIAPDVFIPNSAFRASFKDKKLKEMEPPAFILRLDIINHLPSLQRKDDEDEDDDEWTESREHNAPPKNVADKKSKVVVAPRQQNTTFDLFQRMQSEPWWKKPKENKVNLRSILLYLMEILKLKQPDSFVSSCSYVTEIFRTTGIEPMILNEILDILINHLATPGHDSLDVAAIRTIAEFMIERKYIIVALLEYAIKCQKKEMCREEAIKAIKFITDVNNLSDIELIIEDIHLVYESSEENFSLKMLVQGILERKGIGLSETNEDDEDGEPHPLLKKISEERWFPLKNSKITLDLVLDAIIEKLLTASKTIIKTLTTHLIQLHSNIGYSNEQFDRAANAIISLLSHTDADCRLIAATALVGFRQETKAIDIALLNSFLNDDRVLVRTECCESLKKLTSITSETVLIDCANDVAYLQTLPDEDFSLENYLREKNRLPTPVTSRPSSSDRQDNKRNNIEIDAVNLKIDNKTQKTDDPTPVVRTHTTLSQVQEQCQPMKTEGQPLNVSYSATSTVSPIQPTMRVEINEKSDSVLPRTRDEEAQNMMHQETAMLDTNDATAHMPPSSLLPTDTWNKHSKQKAMKHPNDTNPSPLESLPESQILSHEHENMNELIENMIDEHKRTISFYRTTSNRRVLVPTKISVANVFCDQSHTLINPYSLLLPSHMQNRTMHLSDLNRNQHNLNEIEFVQLLSSLVVRALQVHRQYEKIIPGSYAGSFSNLLNISPIQLHPLSNTNLPIKLPPLLNHRLTSRQLAQIQWAAQKRAAKAGINIYRAQSIEGAISNIFKSNFEQKKKKISPPSILQSLNFKFVDVTHAWLLTQLLKSKGAIRSESYIQRIIQSYPKFIPLLHTKIPQNLVGIIWNDPVLNKIASVFSGQQDQSDAENDCSKQNVARPPTPVACDDDPAMNNDNLAHMRQEEHVKKFLPPIRGSKIQLPHHVIKFGFREIETVTPESPTNLFYNEILLKTRKRRIYMHLMAEHNESTKDQTRHATQNNHQFSSFVPIVSRPPMCH